MVELSSIVKIIKEEFIVILFFLLFISTINYIILFIYGWAGIIYDPPSINDDIDSLKLAREAPDSDSDGLPDVIEQTPRGQVVKYEGVVIGTGTGTNYLSKDSDLDGFTDLAEDKQGTNPNFFFDLGFFWIIWGAFFLGVIYAKYIYKPDRLKEYIRNEEMIRSGGVAGKGKFAYSKRRPEQNLTAEEVDEILESKYKFRD